ncbi:Uncharacterized protein BM_BM17859 [Brugia malayi]|uniref:ANK_REP_REGION domain-containing protein n=1 Tax=Brugia malayi TaxID=6279 RepID=A0A4E9FT02_BRUMA|nr:Uncharacterized protein BM_BM17859 [Brugia malayi]VIO99605.1 Uncharacterized protein BM_BM17859 [Brugia malayi]
MTMEYEEWKEILSAIDKETINGQRYIWLLRSHIDIVKNPLEGNVNVDDDEDKCTPSHCIKGAQATETLIEAGANVNADDKDKCTPSHVSRAYRQQKLIEAGVSGQKLWKRYCRCCAKQRQRFQ